MKQIIVTSRSDFPSKVNNFGEGWAYISIEGTTELVTSGIIKDNTHYLPDSPSTLNLEFDDVEETVVFEGEGGRNYTARPISENQARDILLFAREHMGDNLLIHCLAGKSRSVGVALGILDCYPGIWEVGGKSMPLLTPNQEVLRLIHQVFWKIKTHTNENKK